ncbi:sortase [Luteitalea pratensis]|uniref:Sortase n=1 Tax=Luteitalea pratensis TaxID=1855912 RepID=A0A143PKX6_LUTPR|nr:class D sortase [Luteitalea pratensis]AMY09076.1 sortase [Luteitalea pratensis]
MASPVEDPHPVTDAAPRTRRSFAAAEPAAWLIGVACVVTFGVLHVDRVLGARYEVARFAALQAREPLTTSTPDLTLWEPKRIAAWRSALRTPGPASIGVLRIPKFGLEVPVLPGTDEVTLDRGVGHIDDTAVPGTDGNIGIAGHRDGFFRGLKDIGVGDVIELETHHGKEVYRVQRTWVVSPDDVSVLDATPTRSLTLVTCYPFYFVGPAPERFIVRAERP